MYSPTFPVTSPSVALKLETIQISFKMESQMRPLSRGSYASKLICLFSLAIASLYPISLNAANQVVINAQALQEFSIASENDDSSEPTTYAFMKGKFHGGNRADPAMDEFPFDEVLLDLSTHLQKQNFKGVPDPNGAKLVIVVHYGVTSVQESNESLLGYDSLEDYEFSDGAANSGSSGGVNLNELNGIQDMQFQINVENAIKEGQQGGAFYTARLLGMEKAYVGPISPREELELKNLLSDRRYFMVLMAYDLPLMRQGELVLHWTIRYSIRAIGQSFDQAIKDMNLVAGNYFGKNMGDLVKRRVTDKSRVELGKIEVIGTEEITDSKK